MTTTPLPAIGYIRVGSASPGLVARLQKQRIEEWAAETGHEVTEWVEEFGVPRAGRGLDEAVDRCNGKLIIATASDRISRDATVLREQAEQVRAAGGQLGFVESWPLLNPLDEPSVGWVTAVAASAAADSPRIASYRRRPAGPLGAEGPQQQAAAAWEALEDAGYEVLSVDGAELGRDPRELLDES